MTKLVPAHPDKSGNQKENVRAFDRQLGITENNMPPQLDKSIYDVGLSTRLLNILRAADIETLGDIRFLRLDNMKKYRNFGKETQTEFKEMLLKEGAWTYEEYLDENAKENLTRRIETGARNADAVFIPKHDIENYAVSEMFLKNITNGIFREKTAPLMKLVPCNIEEMTLQLAAELRKDYDVDIVLVVRDRGQKNGMN